MKTLKDYKNELNKCSKCGLCQAVCPIFKITGNECAVSKGKFVMLEGVEKGDLKLSPTINKYLEMCLKCGKCKDFCPSDIEVCDIFATAKHEYIKNSLEGKFVKLLESEFLFDNTIKLLSKFTLKKNFQQRQNAKQKALFFGGCYNKIFPKSENSLKTVLENFDVDLKEADFKCCGVPFLSSGNLERYEEVKSYNLNLINNSDCDFVLTDCASCRDAISKYEGINKKVMMFGEFVQPLLREFLKTCAFEKPLRVTYHKPCHIENCDYVERIFSDPKNFEYIRMKDFDECCGFAGQFAITNRKLSLKISKQKAENILSTGADIVVTECPACILGIKQGFSQIKSDKKPLVMNLTEFVNIIRNK